MNTIINEFKNSQSVSEKFALAFAGALLCLVCVTIPMLVADLITNGAPASFGIYG